MFQSCTRLVHIRSVRSRKQKWSTVYEVLVDPVSGKTDTQTYRTRNALKASLCERAKQSGQVVAFTSVESWFGPEIQSVNLVEQEQSA